MHPQIARTMTSPPSTPSSDFTNRPSFSLLGFSDFTKHVQTPSQRSSPSLSSPCVSFLQRPSPQRETLFEPPYSLSHLHFITILSLPPRALHTRFRALNPHHLKATSAITLSLFTIQNSFPPQQQPFPYLCFLHTASPIPRFFKFESSICLYLQTRFYNLSLSLF